MNTNNPLHGIASIALTHRSPVMLLLALFTCEVSISTSQAQTVPQALNYQGKVTDSTGTGLGTGTPINRKILFRIYDASTAGTKLWSEEQTVTISNGEFSVLLGQGIAATYNAVSEAALHIPLDTVFTTSGIGRYLGVIVDNGDNTFNASDVEITPRQQITTTAYSFRARAADTIAGSSDLTVSPTSAAITGGSVPANYGLGWYGTGRPFGGISVDGPVIYGFGGGGLGSVNGVSQSLALRWNAAGQVGLGIGGDTLAGVPTAKLVLQGDDATATPEQLLIRGNTDTARQLLIGYQTTSNYGSIQANSALATPTNLLLNPSGGNIGIGTTTPGFPLTFANALGDKISFNGQSGVSYGIGVQSSVLQIHSDAVGGDVAFGYGSSAGMTETMRIKGSGKLILQAGSTIDTTNFTGMSFQYYPPSGEGAIMSSYNDGQGYLTFYTKPGFGQAIARRMIITQAGSIGIGASDPTRAKVEINGTAGSLAYGQRGILNSGGALSSASTGTETNASLWVSGNCWASAMLAFSDERIKHIEGRSDSALDLATLLGIDVTDYTYIDTVNHCAGKQKKVIAQQVEKVFPQAVSRTTDTVPDIFQKADVKDAWVSLATNLKKGERVRLIGDHKEGIHAVLEVAEGKFRTDFVPDGDSVFVYGREVKDFRNVDYDAIAMLNVSATQQIKKELDAKVKAMQDENAALRTRLAAQDERLAALETKDKARDAKLAAIEKMLGGDRVKPATRTVSIEKRPPEAGEANP